MKPLLCCSLFMASLLAAQAPAPVVAQVPTIAPTAMPPASFPAQPRRNHKPMSISGTIDSNVLRVEREPPLSPNVRAALAISQAWLNDAPAPLSGSGGRILYVYGKGAPTIVCAEYHACEVDLQPGETVDSKAMDVGDDRFMVTARTAGSGAGQFTYLVLKPKQSGLDTSLMVGTDHRPYYFHLVSTTEKSPYMARVAFDYPDDDEQQRKALKATQKMVEDQQKAEEERLAKLNTDKPIRNWNYSVKLHGRDAKYLRPKRIGDDGTHTHILLSEEARHRGLPVVKLGDARGPIPANTRWDGNELIIDAVFAKACLLEGVGRHQQRACITNSGLQEN